METEDGVKKKKPIQMPPLFFGFLLCGSRARESLLDVSQTSNKKEKPQTFQNKKRNSNLKFFLSQEYGSEHSVRARKAGRYTSPPRCSSIHSSRHRYSGIIFFFFFYFYFFVLYAFTYIYSSINRSMWQMFSVGPAFKGIKMIPPASHFLYYSSSTRLL